MRKLSNLIASLLLMINGVYGQGYLFPINRDAGQRLGAILNADSTGFHTSMLPYATTDLKTITDPDTVISIRMKGNSFSSSWLGRKLRTEHLLESDKDELKLAVDPLFNLQAGKDRFNGRSVYLNTRGAQVLGNYRDRFFFYSAFHENQARYLSYVDSTIRQYQVVPGQGRVKFLDHGAVDFSNATGGIAYVVNRHFDFLLAQDRLFIGDGYRSMLLSDNSHPFPFLRAQMTFWKFRYSAIYAVLQDLRTNADENTGYPKKYATFHYLDVNIGRKNRLTAGIFESVIWKPSASRGYELYYLNPVLFLRPVENSLGSPDNAILGLNLRWKASRSTSIYGQLVLDEFMLHEVRDGRGWWGNKQAGQLGVKSYDLFGVRHLDFRSEANLARPFTYQHRSTLQNYANYNQALAHPLGTDFYESVTFLSYRWWNFFAEVRLQYARCGKDTGGVNLGNDIFKSYDTRPFEYGYYLTTGLSSTLESLGFRVNYLVNRRTNLVVEAGTELRRFTNTLDRQRSDLVYVGLRTSLQNFYFDF